MCAGNHIDSCHCDCHCKKSVREISWSSNVHVVLHWLGPWIDDQCLMHNLLSNTLIVRSITKLLRLLVLEPYQVHGPSCGRGYLSKRFLGGPRERARKSMSRETRVPFEKILPPTLAVTEAYCCNLVLVKRCSKGAVSFGSTLHRSCTLQVKN